MSSLQRAPIVLHCGHPFCSECLLTFVRSRNSSQHGASCPLCRERLRCAELLALGMSSDEAAAIVAAGDAPGPEAPPQVQPPRTYAERRAQRQFMKAARRAHLKYCPRCRAMIEKFQGCDHMRCHCGCDFAWSRAESVVPCRRLHWSGEAGLCRYWGTTCAGCSHIATAKLLAWRSAAAVAAVPACTVGMVAATATVAVPAAVCCVPALLYEPVRRYRRRVHNPFAKGMCVGLFVGFLAVKEIFHDDDSD